ncbi:MAG TPA: MOSC domain-containing protein [Anaerolineaceae bacterium]|nr:MOSC domain-containing protein [Anaerolineaceae bacterium]
MLDAKLISIQVGKPNTYSADDPRNPRKKPWTTSIFKEPAPGPVWLGKFDVEGNYQANQKVHGGPDKAVNCYPAEHYPFWQVELGRAEKAANGSFGENFTTHGLIEDAVCIGDVYRVGEAIVQVSQPRQPCDTLASRWGVPDFIERVNTAGKMGWYLRVLQEGHVQAGDVIKLEDRHFEEWTILRAMEIMTCPEIDPASTRALAQCSLLSEDWRVVLARKAARLR